MIVEALQKFERWRLFKPARSVENARRFGKERFHEQFAGMVEREWTQFLSARIGAWPASRPRLRRTTFAAIEEAWPVEQHGRYHKGGYGFKKNITNNPDINNRFPGPLWCINKRPLLLPAAIGFVPSALWEGL